MSTNQGQSSKAANVALWVLQVLLAAMFLMAGITKLLGQEMMVENFEKIGIGQWFRYVTGAVEIIAAVILLVPRFSALGAGLLVCTMIGASVAHLTALGGSAIPPVVLGALAAIVFFGRRHSLFALVGTDYKTVSEPAIETIG